tara:strand:- start:5551 stop:7401 length:1851 start_codon:yes stop_codon:yes gene_type:complete
MNSKQYNNIINTSNNDYLLASDILYRNLNKIKKYRIDNNLDPTPTIGDIQETHLIYVISEYKPHISISNEYIKEKLIGTHNLNSNIKIPISQYGDFINDMVLHITFGYKNNKKSYIKPNDSVDSNGRSKYKFCNYPGERLIKSCSFIVNGQTLDKYTTEDVTFWKEFALSSEGKREWNKLVGQEIPVDGYYNLNNSIHDTSDNFFTNSIVKNYYEKIDLSYIKDYNYFDDKELNTRIGLNICNGYQTPKFEHKKLDLWIPLLFWFNKDVNLSIPTIAIPYSDKYVSIDLCEEDKLITLVPSDMDLNDYMVPYSDISNIFTDKNYGSNAYKFGQNNLLLWDEDNLNAYKNRMKPNINNLKINNIELYVNNIFIDPELHDIFIQKMGFTLIRTHQHQIIETDSNKLDINLYKFKWPIETLYLGMRMAEYETSNMFNFDIWNTFGFYPEYRLNYINNIGIIDPSLNWHNTLTNYNGDLIYTSILNNSIRYREYIPTLDTLSLSTQGSKLMENFSYKLYSQYIPWKHNGTNSHIQQNNQGASMITFALHPGNYQPSGHINLSRTDDLKLSYTSSIIGQSSNWWTNKNSSIEKPQGKLYITGISINFLVINNGTLLLRFTS